MNRKAFACLVITFALYIPCASAETIELKNGREIIGEIIQETEDVIVVSKHDGGFIYSISRDRIKAVRSSSPEEIEMYKLKKKAASMVDEEKEKTKKEKLEQYRLERYEKEVLLAKKARGRIKIKFSKGRFGVVDALLNKKVTASLLVDSGASHVVISEAIARQLGIEDLEDKPTVHAVLADGSVTTGLSITLDSVKVGDSEVKNVNTTVSKRPPGAGLDGLLGMTFLSHFHLKLDAKENCLVLEKY
ncbi:MAG: retropepsin-like aspartic protease [Candidatus Omnitrophota bacterium]